MLEEVQAAGHLRLDLVGAAEDVRVVLLEPAHPGQTSQRARQLVPNDITNYLPACLKLSSPSSVSDP